MLAQRGRFGDVGEGGGSDMNTENQVQVLELPEMKLVGLYVTSPFKGHNPQRVEDMKQEFYRRKDEIEHVIHPERYVSPSFTSEVLFTYLISMEVAEIKDVPRGMIGFTIPPHCYAKVKSKGDPYKIIHQYLDANQYKNDGKALALEVYRFDNPVWPDEAEVFIPLR
jgi:predicted transcriptional regulator YdeE